MNAGQVVLMLDKCLLMQDKWFWDVGHVGFLMLDKWFWDAGQVFFNAGQMVLGM